MFFLKLRMWLLLAVLFGIIYAAIVMLGTYLGITNFYFYLISGLHPLSLISLFRYTSRINKILLEMSLLGETKKLIQRDCNQGKFSPPGFS